MVRKVKTEGRDGRPALKTLIRVSDLDEGLEHTRRDAHVQRIRASAAPLTIEQKIAIRDVLLEHLLEREEKRRRGIVKAANEQRAQGA